MEVCLSCYAEGQDVSSSQAQQKSDPGFKDAEKKASLFDGCHIPTPLPCFARPSSQIAAKSRTPICVQMSAFVKSTATTFAPRSSTAVKNPAYKGKPSSLHVLGIRGPLLGFSGIMVVRCREHTVLSLWGTGMDFCSGKPVFTPHVLLLKHKGTIADNNIAYRWAVSCRSTSSSRQTIPALLAS